MNISGKQILVGGILLLAGLIGGVAVTFAMTGDASGTVDQSADEAKIQEVLEGYATAVNEDDFESWIALWDEGGIRVPPPDFGPPQYSKEEIRAAMQPLFEVSDQTATIDTELTRILGDEAYSLATFEITVTPKEGGDTMVLKGNALSILKKQPDDSWKIAIDTFNFDNNTSGSAESVEPMFPTGRFVASDNRFALEFDEDGSWRGYNGSGDSFFLIIRGKYAINDNLYTEMTHTGNTEKIPATYYWEYDGEQLSFELWGEDNNRYRKSVYDQITYVKAEQTP